MSVAPSVVTPVNSPVDSTFSGVSTAYSVSAYNSTPFRKNSRGYPTTTIAELVIAEAHYLSTLKRVGNALNLASNHSLAAGRKASNTIRELVERWTTMMRIHIKFHDKSGHTPAEWDTALRHPFDHLTVYNEWLQRIDPSGSFTGPCLAQLNKLVLNVKGVIEANQNPRGMLKRISTFARGVIKRPSSAQLLQNHQQQPGSEDNVVSPTHTTTIQSFASTTTSNVNTPSTAVSSQVPSPPTSTHGGSHAVKAREKLRIETVTDQAPKLPMLTPTSGRLTLSPSTASNLTAESPTTITSVVPNRHPHRLSMAASDVSSVGSLTLAPSSESLSAKAMQHNRSVSTSLVGSSKAGSARPHALGHQGSSISSASEKQKFLEEREARKATLRMGAQAFIVARAESLQQQHQEQPSSPTFVSRPEIDRLRTITRRETETKPPVKSLISFWEQATEPTIEV
ncbi:hypothetical protein EMPS_03626 [Entomortierella parvispora]|uniref:DH domain-containing protein n=1 Tax=Entomortierella parvispora TaxID=205924 RepID=A0A9P3LUL3_9FUNG|nr:hypothetical protein EMPS_03626 [Entomortierella parvispora]